VSTFNSILDKYRKISFSERDKGERFERLMQAYLQTDPKYAYLFKKVWLWTEFIGRNDLGGSDMGIDLVALTFDGDFWAIQCKCFQESTIIDKAAVDSFLSTSSRKFKDEGMKTTGFAHRLWISTTNRWGPNATEAIRNQNPPVTRLNLYELQEAPVDWIKLDQGISGELSRTPKKELRPHQRDAMEKTHEHFKTADRGKLIMACGTGKTFNSLRIAESETGGQGLILFLVPSIALLSQSLREWSADAVEPINAICICSDPEVSRKKSKNEDADNFSVIDLALPASTNVKDIVAQFNHIRAAGKEGMTVVFSTYQSIDVIARTQQELLNRKDEYGTFDLIICDEAHRTTGVTLSEEDSSAFIKVHNNDFIKGKKRLYMTATPRLYNEDSKSKAAQAEAILCSMDDPALYGEEIYRIGFGEAVDRDLLTDYKVLILTLNENDIPPAIQRSITNEESEITTDDASKLIGCINALSKQIIGDDGSIKESDPEPMRRAVAFCSKIVASKKISETFNNTTDVYLNALPPEKKEQMVTIASRHIDGTMTAPERDELLGWLKADSDVPNECRILTNVRCLSEGVDVPSLDSVMFLSARNSQVDVVQSVGRVMRKSPGTNKKYGYIIIPVVVPADIEPDKALDDNERYKVVWTVLNALRAHDDRFNATVNKIELNKSKPYQILVGRPEYSWEDGQNMAADKETLYGNTAALGHQLTIQFEQLQSAVFAKMVQKVGDKRYWEQWAKDVAIIAERQIERIRYLIENKKDQRKAFNSFLSGLQKNINPSISESQGVEMLAQHLITQPIFEALFEGYSFVKNNPVSKAMQSMLHVLEEGSNLAAQDETLQKFYDSVRKRAEGIDNAEGKQRIIIELYDKFFKAAFPKMVEQLGIVYTPIEVVDFIIHSVSDVLQKEFGRSISDENIHILDPFTGTGTFITRLLQSGLIKNNDLLRKYTHEIHANEIVLLAYYIASVNIENAYHDVTPDLYDGIGKENYIPFEGICLTDTFQLGETEDGERLFSEMFPQNSERVQRQKKAPLRIIIGNPPYSAGQRSANDDAQNLDYVRLDSRIGETYAKETSATNKNSLYDSYIRAFRWSTDRLDTEHGGIIGFVSNGGWIDSNSSDGFRKVLEKEFSSIWVFNLRGNQRTSGETSRKEGGKVFGSGSRNTIAITLLVKNPEVKRVKASIYYHDIGDYLSREDKLSKIGSLRSVVNPKMDWRLLHPNAEGDWISVRNDLFSTFIPLGDKDNKQSENTFFRSYYSNGLKTQRDAWCYNSFLEKLKANIITHIDFYNQQRRKYLKEKNENPGIELTKFVDKNSQKISWTRALEWDAEKDRVINIEDGDFRTANYRPYFKQNLYFSKTLNEMQYQIPKLFPSSNSDNLVICVSAHYKDGSVLIANSIPDLHFNGDTQAFPLYYYEERKKASPSLFDLDGDSEFIRHEGITDFILHRAQNQYGRNVNKEDIFYYVYGLLHSPEYRIAFSSDLKKMLPRLPLVEDVKDFWKFSNSGRKLADLHINYESVPAYPGVTISGDDSGFFTVEKMRYPKKGQTDTILYNSQITISGIPDKAYKYVINGKSAIEWIMERYQVTTHKESGIRNDPNDWAKEVGHPRYILDLLLSVINVSVQTVEIVEGLPKLTFE